MLQYSLSQLLKRTKITTTIKNFSKNVYINNINMLCYNRIEISEGINVNKTSEEKDRDICHYWYFLDTGFKIQPDVCKWVLIILM